MKTNTPMKFFVRPSVLIDDRLSNEVTALAHDIIQDKLLFPLYEKIDLYLLGQMKMSILMAEQEQNSGEDDTTESVERL